MPPDAHPDPRHGAFHVASEGFHDQDLPRPFGFVLVPDHPESDHVGRVVESASAKLEQAEGRRVQRHVRLGLANDHPRREVLLADPGADGSGEGARLDRGDPQPAIELGAPRGLIGVNP